MIYHIMNEASSARASYASDDRLRFALGMQLAGVACRVLAPNEQALVVPHHFPQMQHIPSGKNVVWSPFPNVLSRHGFGAIAVGTRNGVCTSMHIDMRRNSLGQTANADIGRMSAGRSRRSTWPRDLAVACTKLVTTNQTFLARSECKTILWRDRCDTVLRRLLDFTALLRLDILRLRGWKRGSNRTKPFKSG